MFIRQNDTGKVGIGTAVSVADGYTVTSALLLSTADSARARLGDDTTVDISGYTWAATASMDGCYDLTLQTGITDTVGPLEIMIEDVSLCLPIYVRFYVLEETVYDALFAASSLGFSATASITAAAPASTTKPPATPTEKEMLEYLYWRLIYGKVTVDATEEIVFADDGTTELYTKSVGDAAGTVTYGEAAAGA
jgi:hypothetical protein